MLTKSANYNTIWNNANHYAEVMLIVGEVGGTRTTYRENSILSLSTNSSLFGDYFDIGNVVMNQVNIKMHNVLPNAIPKFSRVEVWTRLTDGTDYTNWLPKGIFYTKKPTYNTESKVLEVSGYDQIFKTEVIPFEKGSVLSAFNSPTIRQFTKHIIDGTVVANVINSNFAGCDLVLEDETQLSTSITMPSIPFGYSVRDMLSEIAVAECGNWMFTYVNVGTPESPVMQEKLRLVKIANMES